MVVKKIVPFHVANEIQIDPFAKLESFECEFVAFVVFGAVAQNADARFFPTENFAGLDAAHDGEMQKMQRTAFDARAGIQENEFIFRGGDDGDNRWTIHAGQLAQTDGGSGDQPARVAWGNDRIGFSGLDQFNGAKDRTIFFSSETFDGFVHHGENLSRVNNFQAAILKLAASERGLNFLLLADEKQFADFGVGGQGEFDPIDDDAAPVVATHDINCDSHKPKKSS